MIGTDEPLHSSATPVDPAIVNAVERLVVGGDDALPMLPEVALQVMRVCRDPDADPRALAALIERDPQIAGRVIRMANSAAFAAVAPILSLPQALARLGFSRVGEIALAVACRAQLFDVPGHERRLRSVLHHSALAGGLGREIARGLRRNVEEAFLAGLLHDVGKPLVLQAAANAGAVGDGTTTEGVEELLERHHALVGARLIEAWDLGESLSAVVATHHAEPDEEAGELWFILCLADDMARALTASENPERVALLRDFVDHPAVGPLNLYADDVETIVDRVDDVLAFAEILA